MSQTVEIVSEPSPTKSLGESSDTGYPRSLLSELSANLPIIDEGISSRKGPAGRVSGHDPAEVLHPLSCEYKEEASWAVVPNAEQEMSQNAPRPGSTPTSPNHDRAAGGRDH